MPSVKVSGGEDYLNFFSDSTERMYAHMQLLTATKNTGFALDCLLVGEGFKPDGWHTINGVNKDNKFVTSSQFYTRGKMTIEHTVEKRTSDGVLLSDEVRMEGVTPDDVLVLQVVNVFRSNYDNYEMDLKFER
jgi:hypothetical protein